jgi:hypothetical protein
MHGDDDQIVPYADSAPLSAKLLKNGTLKTYKSFPHGMPAGSLGASGAHDWSQYRSVQPGKPVLSG